jgi:hypothetical protein
MGELTSTMAGDLLSEIRADSTITLIIEYSFGFQSAGSSGSIFSREYFGFT